MLKKTGRAIALLLALALVLAAGGCGVAQFSDEEIAGHGAAASGAQARSDSSDAALREQMVETRDVFNALVERYNTGAEAFAAAADDGVPVPESLAGKFTKLGESVEEYRDKTGDAALQKLSEGQLRALREEMDALIAEVDDHLEALAQAVAQHEAGAASAG